MLNIQVFYGINKNLSVVKLLNDTVLDSDETIREAAKEAWIEFNKSLNNKVSLCTRPQF